MKRNRPNHGIASVGRFTLLLFSICMICEILVRVTIRELLETNSNEFSLHYQYDHQLGWFPKENSGGKYFGSAPFEIEHNNRGFRDHDHLSKSKKRILFLGDSFVWGYDLHVEDRFTNLVQDSFPNWEVINMGVSGYGTDQAYLLLLREIAFYQPDVVFLLFNYHTDARDNNLNKNYGHYYKPIYISDGNYYRLHGVPVPRGLEFYALRYPVMMKSYLVRLLFQLIRLVQDPIHVLNDPDVSSYLVTAMRDLVEEHNATFLLGFTGMDADHSELQFCKSEQLACIDVSTNFRFPTMGYHWTPKGHQIVSQKIVRFLKEQGL